MAARSKHIDTSDLLVIELFIVFHHLTASRDAIAKSLYDRLFRWIVNRINQLLAPSAEDLAQSKEIGKASYVSMCLPYLLYYRNSRHLRF